MKYVILIFSLIPRLLWSQFHFDFEIDTSQNMGKCINERFEQYPALRWNCHKEGAISGDYSLRQTYDNQESGCDYMIITLDPFFQSDSLIFSFRLKHGYPPSSANNWQVGVLADFSDGKINEGLFLGVNHTGSDDVIKLWKYHQGDCKEICSTRLNYQEQIGNELAPQFKLIRTRQGALNIYFTKNPLDEPLEQIGFCQLDSLPEGRQVLIRYEYSSAQDRNLWIDDLMVDGHFVSDTVVPFIRGVKVLDGQSMEISFSESVLLPKCYSFLLSGSSLGSMNPDSVYINRHRVFLNFPRTIPNREQLELWVEEICDWDGNCLTDTLIPCIRNDAVWGDVVFNELMVDPTPKVLLPEEEYVEIFNRSEFEIDLSGWWMDVNGQAHLIDGLNVQSQGSGEVRMIEQPPFKLAPDAYLVITEINLPNEGATLSLYSEIGALIHALRYGLPRNTPEWKRDGGWSLESPDPDQVCNFSSLWEFSLNPWGGTPGFINSLDTDLEDVTLPVFLYAGYGSGLLGQPEMMRFYYSEPVLLNPLDQGHFMAQPGNIVADSLLFQVPIADKLDVWFPETLHERLRFRVEIPALSDCAGNLSHRYELQAGRISEVLSGSLLINEIMYDPVEGAPEFIELYIPGEGFYDLRDLALDVVPDGSLPIKPVALSDHSRIISTGEYVVLSRDQLLLMEAYNLEISGRWIGLKSMEGLPNSGGTVYLTDRAGSVVDQANYGDQMHMELINVTQGISLERISSKRSGTDLENWHSAASIEGYSTPGRENSQAVKDSWVNELIKVEPKVFSPDNNGFQDLLEIRISPGNQGWIINVWIIDLDGRTIWTMANNHLAGTSVTYTWDGIGGNGQMADEGIYVLFAKGYHPITGESWMKKEAFGLIYP